MSCGRVWVDPSTLRLQTAAMPTYNPSDTTCPGHTGIVWRGVCGPQACRACPLISTQTQTPEALPTCRLRPPECGGSRGRFGHLGHKTHGLPVCVPSLQNVRGFWRRAAWPYTRTWHPYRTWPPAGLGSLNCPEPSGPGLGDQVRSPVHVSRTTYCICRQYMRRGRDSNPDLHVSETCVFPS